MQKGLIFLLIICTASTFTSGNNTYHLQFSLGCSAVILCQHKRGDSPFFQWFYKKEIHSEKIQIFFEQKGEPSRLHNNLRNKLTVTANGSLVIKFFTEDDQGLYWCNICNQNCKDKMITIISVDKEILNETYETFYVTAGSSFTHECPGKFTKWTFKGNTTTALHNSNPRTQLQELETDVVTSTKSIHIVNVRIAEAGKYTCWKPKCDGHIQKLFTINLCVITVEHSEDASVSCAVICGEFNNIKPNSTSYMETDTRTVSVSVEPYGSLNCSAKQMFDGYGSVNNSTHEPIVSNKTTGAHIEPEYRMLIIYGTSAGFACLISVTLLICCLRQRLRADFSVCSPGCDMCDEVEEDTSVVYLSVVIRRPAKTANNQMTNSDCVYSELKV
ncbi:hypothetical protein PAMP_002848 [Pampus punctatissimus]